MRLGLLRETAPGENRVALVPGGVKTLAQHGWEVLVTRGAGSICGIDDAAYRAAGATVLPAGEVHEARVLVSVRDLPPGPARSGRPGAPEPVFVGVFDPLWAPERARRHADDGNTAFSLDLVPRITRAQTMDVLSSMATIAGYEAVLLAAARLPQMFPLMMTAAGTLAPARVLVLGAGVAGLQAIATARRLGAVVEGYDVRPAAVEQIRSMGARAVEIDLPAGEGASGAENPDADSVEDAGGYARAQSEAATARQQDLLAPHVAEADVVITTAAIPGRASPRLVTAEMVEAMAAGSVVVDLAAERGGNCALTRPDEEVTVDGVTVLGPTDLVSRCSRHASQMFSRNLVAFLRHIAPGGEIDLGSGGGNSATRAGGTGGETGVTGADRAEGERGVTGATPGDRPEDEIVADEIVAAVLVAHAGRVVHPAVAAALSEEAAAGDPPVTAVAG